MISVYRSIFLWFIHLDYIIHGHVAIPLYIHTSSYDDDMNYLFSEDEENVTDSLENIFSYIQKKHTTLDQNYTRVINKLIEEEEKLLQNRCDIINNSTSDLYQLHLTNNKNAKNKMAKHFNEAYTKLSMERDYLLQRLLDNARLKGGKFYTEENAFEKAFLEKQSNEQRHQMQLSHLAALTDEKMEIANDRARTDAVRSPLNPLSATGGAGVLGC